LEAYSEMSQWISPIQLMCANKTCFEGKKTKTSKQKKLIG
jgi:hypothetical protein